MGPMSGRGRRRAAALAPALIIVVVAVAVPWRDAPRARAPVDAERLSLLLARNAKSFCSGLFVVGRGAEETLASGDLQRWTFLDWFDWDEVDVAIDAVRGRVTLTHPPAPPRTAAYNGDQGCTILPVGMDRVAFTPLAVPPALPAADGTPWPMGDVTEGQPVRGIDRTAVAAALEVPFQENDGERAWVVVHEGVIAGERYAPGFDRETRNLAFSMGKSLMATLVGILVQDGHLSVKDPAPLPEWQAPDARSLITVEHLLHMAGGLDCENLPARHADHFTAGNHHHLVYNEGVDVRELSVGRPLRYLPGAVHEYRNCNTLALGAIVRSVAERRYDVPWLAFPQRALFDRIGARSFVLEPDPWGNFVMTGHNYASARDWARLGLLHLQDGLWNGERILPAGWAEYVSTPSPANPGYGAQWWLALPGQVLPRGSYWASGAEGQRTLIVPSHGLVIARAAFAPTTDFEAVAAAIVEAVASTAEQCREPARYGFEREAECLDWLRERGPQSPATRGDAAAAPSSTPGP